MYMPYIENQQQASFFLLSKLVEISGYDSDDLSGMSVREVEERLEEERYSLSNSFEYRGMSLYIREATFVDIVRQLLKRKWLVGHIDTFSIKEEGVEDVLEGFVDGVELGRRYPDVPALELANETSLDFLIRDKEAIKGHLATIPVIEGIPENEEDVVFRVEYDGRNIKVNSMFLSKPNFEGVNHKAFDYIYANPNIIIHREDIRINGEPLKKSLIFVVRELAFINELKYIFFPDTSKDAMRFLNPVRKKDIPKELQDVDIREVMKVVRRKRKGENREK